MYLLILSAGICKAIHLLRNSYLQLMPSGTVRPVILVTISASVMIAVTQKSIAAHAAIETALTVSLYSKRFGSIKDAAKYLMRVTSMSYSLFHIS
jgi:hypothetical protein